MLKKLAVSAAILGFVAAAAPPALAQNACGMRDDIIGVLSNKYHEQHQASGLQNASSMVEIWASAETGTWTILVTRANGMSCVVASGKNWLQMEAAEIAGGLKS